MSFASKEEMARLTARMLLEIGAVNFRPEDPFTLASGKPSPSYID
ncbi:MAG: orotate phosphoribosyltransferase, partial [Pseudomonadota bacterium]